MSNQIKVGRFTPDGSTDIALPLGFIPDYIRFEEVGEATSPNIITWFRAQEADATGDRAGQYLTGTSGVVTKLSDDAGIKAYDTGSQAPTIQEWTQTRATNATARTATAPGTYIKPTVSSDRPATFTRKPSVWRAKALTCFTPSRARCTFAGRPGTKGAAHHSIRASNSCRNDVGQS